MTIIDFNTISPVQLRSLEPSLIDTPQVIHEKEAFQRYLRREIQYWAKITSSVHQIAVYKKSKGVRCVVPSPNNRFIAVGTFHGDIMVYDVLLEPWRPYRVQSNNQKSDLPHIDITWSLDSSRIICINSLGLLQVLSLVSGLVETKTARETLLLPADDKGTYPHHLQHLLTLDVEKQDFVFQQGALADEGAQSDVGLAPEKASFFPSFSFFGTQNEMIVSLENGDLLKCNIQNCLQAANDFEEDSPTEAPRIYKPSLVTEEEASNINTVGKNVEAELLRGHKKSIIYITFVEGLNAMITVDEKGFINKWKYNIKFKSSFGWYTPSRKYRLETSKIMYKESDADKPKVVFTDQSAAGKKPRTRQEIAAQRRRAQNTIDNMQLGDPWHEEYIEADDVKLQIFAPRGVIADSGAMFHLVYRHTETDQLSAYVTRLYKPVKVRCTRIVRVIGSPTNTEIVVVLLFGPYPPKGPHFTIFVIDLKTMELRDYRNDIDLTPQEYSVMMTKTIISCDMTRVFGPTGSEYLFVIFNGILRCLSLTTGQPVVKVGPKKVHGQDEDDEDEGEAFKGCIVDETLLQPAGDAECRVLAFEGRIHCVVFARKTAKMYVITFEDKNVYGDRRAMWKTYTSLPGHKMVPTELRVNTHNWKLEEVQHPAVNVRKILLKKIDMEMRKAGLIRDHPKVIRRIALSDKVENYKSLDKAVTESTLLEKEGVMQKQAVSRLSHATPEVEEEEKF